MVQVQERIVEGAMIEFVVANEQLNDFCRACGQRFCDFCNLCDVEGDGLCCTCRYQMEKDGKGVDNER